MNKEEARTLISRTIHPILGKIDVKLLDTLLQHFVEQESLYPSDGQNKAGSDVIRLIRFLTIVIEETLQHIRGLRKTHEDFVQLCAHSTSQYEERQHILNYAKKLGATEIELKGDQDAFSRWFGADALSDRYTRRIAVAERQIGLCFQLLGPLVAHVFSMEDYQDNIGELWLQFRVEPLIATLFDYSGDPRVLIAAFRCLVTALQGLPAEVQEHVVKSATLQFIYRTSLEKNKNIWLQCEALRLLQTLSPDSMIIALEKCLTQAAEVDDFFVRRRGVLLLTSNSGRYPALERLIAQVANDPSPYVRQALAQNLDKLTPEAFACWFPTLALQDKSPQVRAAAILVSLKLLQPTSLEKGQSSAPRFEKGGIAEVLIPHSPFTKGGVAWWLQNIFPCILGTMQATLAQESDSFVLRVTLKIVVDGYNALSEHQPEFANQWLTTLTPLVETLHISAFNLTVRRWAGQTMLHLWCAADPEAKALRKQLNNLLGAIPPGTRTRFPIALLRTQGEARVGRVLAVLAQKNFGFVVQVCPSKAFVTRGNIFGFKLWRFLYELAHASSDKRQGFRHTVGRIFKGKIRAPSAILAEMAETKVPGEPLFLSSEEGYRPYLPLLDDLLSALTDPHGMFQLYTSEGITTVRAPQGAFERLKVWWQLNTHFPRYARLRNWREQSQSNPNRYVRTLQALGFSVEFNTYDQKQADPTVTRFFGTMAIPELPLLWEQMKDYFFSAYQNTLSDLVLFVLVVIALFLGRHWFANRKIRQAREAFPLCIGGWGTRGKSGTERLKAALFNALGYSIVSKTTGCEAMLLLAPPFQKMHEMYLFRPYEKATIWEYADVMHYARQFNADVFLWECMALTPDYVHLMQRHWGRDDLSTITNTYPDHEDIQGPAGINIPEVMVEFIPKAGRLLTTEEQMLPILGHACELLQTELSVVDWLDSGFLTPDVLERFPYSEHPSNIALVLKLGEKLGLDRDFALKEMAEHLLPDLGALKTYPTAEINSRRLIFVNGMSANESFACLENWSRMHFDKQDPYQEPGVWISTVVNNRADRVTRSRVFASLLVNELSADQHFLIGTNLSGLTGYIGEAWRQFVSQTTLWPHSETAENVRTTMLGFAKRYRIPYAQEHVIDRLRAMLVGVGLNKDSVDELLSLWNSPKALAEKLTQTPANPFLQEIIDRHAQNMETCSQYQKFLSDVENVQPHQREALDIRFRAHLEKWFMQKISVIEDANASGDQIINHIARKTPPGYVNRMMGIQNIKGTGLDFVYRWQAWNTCYQACKKLRQKEPVTVEEGLRDLSAFQEFNLLCEKYIRDTLAQVKHTTTAQQEWFQAEMENILSRLNIAMEQIKLSLQATPKTGWMHKMARIIESLLDTDNAIKRRIVADRIYKDLIVERISMERAAIELMALNKQQKKG